MSKNNNFTQSKPEIKRSAEFIIGMAKSCRLARKTLEYTASFLKPGISTLELEKIAHDFMIKHNARPATLNYQGFPSSICVSINEVICHGIPSDRKLCATDIINIDVTCDLNGYFGDTSATYDLGKAPQTAKKLMEVSKKCLNLGIAACRAYGSIGDIGYAISQYAHSQRFSVVERFVGHGIGRNFHEDPQVMHIAKANTGPQILPGMFFTIEPMINEGKPEAVILEDGWTAVTIDRKLSAQYEHTIYISTDGVRVLTAEDDNVPLL